MVSAVRPKKENKSVNANKKQTVLHEIKEGSGQHPYEVSERSSESGGDELINTILDDDELAKAKQSGANQISKTVKKPATQ